LKKVNKMHITGETYKSAMVTMCRWMKACLNIAELREANRDVLLATLQEEVNKVCIFSLSLSFLLLQLKKTQGEGREGAEETTLPLELNAQSRFYLSTCILVLFNFEKSFYQHRCVLANIFYHCHFLWAGKLNPFLSIQFREKTAKFIEAVE
jgi:hypothetical protein